MELMCEVDGVSIPCDTVEIMGYDMLSRVIVDRHGHDYYTDYMTTDSIIGHLEIGGAYHLGGKIVKDEDHGKRNEVVVNNDDHHVKYSVLPNTWQNVENDRREPTICNILGDDGVFYVSSDNLVIPAQEANNDNLSFYGARLYKTGEVFYNHSDYMMPVTTMSMGENYLDNFILNNDFGKGLNIEYHDSFHWHESYNENSAGYYILGKFSDTQDELYLSAFSIPYGAAIYTPPYAVHCDSGLIGEYIVMYTVADKSHTVVVFKEDGNACPVSFKEI